MRNTQLLKTLDNKILKGKALIKLLTQNRYIVTKKIKKTVGYIKKNYYIDNINLVNANNMKRIIIDSNYKTLITVIGYLAISTVALLSGAGFVGFFVAIAAGIGIMHGVINVLISNKISKQVVELETNELKLDVVTTKINKRKLNIQELINEKNKLIENNRFNISFDRYEAIPLDSKRQKNKKMYMIK